MENRIGKMIDCNINLIRSTLTDRNAWELDNNDAVGLMLDTYNDGRNA